MKITCRCGALIPDQTDSLPHKAHVIADEAWHGLLDRLDADVVDRLAAGRLSADGAAMVARMLLSEAARPAYECPACGRLYVDDPQGALQSYAPEGPTRGVLRAG